MIPSVVVALLDGDDTVIPFLIAAFFATSIGAGVNHGVRLTGELRTGDSYLMVAGGWLVASAWGALPYLLTGATSSPVDAWFEAVSGFTTTGSTIFADVESLPRSVLLWRSMTQWLGGMGIIVMAVAILPALGAAGHVLFAAEVPGLVVERLRPRIAATSRLLWGVYAALTALQVLALWRFSQGVDLFTAVNHAFTTMSTGGFSTFNASAGALAPVDQWIVGTFIFLGGANFALHFRALSGRPLAHFHNEEFRLYAGMVLAITAVFAASLAATGRAIEPALRAGFFQTVSLITTTGYVTEDYLRWPQGAEVLVLLLLLAGGCSGSTSGGIKQERLLCLWRAGAREVRKLLHPHGVFPLKINGKALPAEVSTGVMGFVAFYMITVLAGAMLLSFSGLDLATAIGASASSLGNVGPGLGTLGAVDTYAPITPMAKLTASSLMLIGRLELMTVFVVVTGLWQALVRRRRRPPAAPA